MYALVDPYDSEATCVYENIDNIIIRVYIIILSMVCMKKNGIEKQNLLESMRT